ncbi:ArdC family protein [Sphingomonas xinjiangensis]|uniref:Antirestriction protein ArdC n=1 Tax=Sphingomonas xinjiangensis TaxID=643568 RepID=A0A840YFZ9_9SPHN|nr:zincin-like metallopeptidase domain-containing protein [Sphingomonas xinjiangensis]MBB5712377.1 antirestriction protein ArdC [Sphingomonas xinjiangensis]
MTRPITDIAGEVTRLMVRKLEQGVVPWQRPWALTGEGGRPLRHEGTPYTGINCPWLWAMADAHGYRSRYWMTARQAQELGGCVRSGATPTISIYASTFRKAGTSPLTGEATSRMIRFLRSYLVYNADEIDGLPPWYYPRDIAPTPQLISERQEAISAFFDPIPAEVRHGGDRAYYAIFPDRIQMPKPETFRTIDAYWGCRAHETAHWSGGPTRLDRTFGKRLGDKAYAVEELVAELSSAMVCAELGLPTELHENHASYIGHWIDVLKADKSAIFLASSKAEQAVTFLRNFGAAREALATAA